jgi:hypothetical protein
MKYSDGDGRLDPSETMRDMDTDATAYLTEQVYKVMLEQMEASEVAGLKRMSLVFLLSIILCFSLASARRALLRHCLKDTDVKTASSW